MKVKKDILEADSVEDQVADQAAADIEAEAEVDVPKTPKKKDLGMIFNVLNKSLKTAQLYCSLVRIGVTISAEAVGSCLFS